MAILTLGKKPYLWDLALKHLSPAKWQQKADLQWPPADLASDPPISLCRPVSPTQSVLGSVVVLCTKQNAVSPGKVFRDFVEDVCVAQLASALCVLAHLRPQRLLSLYWWHLQFRIFGSSLCVVVPLHFTLRTRSVLCYLRPSRCFFLSLPFLCLVEWHGTSLISLQTSPSSSTAWFVSTV